MTRNLQASQSGQLWSKLSFATLTIFFLILDPIFPKNMNRSIFASNCAKNIFWCIWSKILRAYFPTPKTFFDEGQTVEIYCRNELIWKSYFLHKFSCKDKLRVNIFYTKNRNIFIRKNWNFFYINFHVKINCVERGNFVLKNRIPIRYSNGHALLYKIICSVSAISTNRFIGRASKGLVPKS